MLKFLIIGEPLCVEFLIIVLGLAESLLVALIVCQHGLTAELAGCLFGNMRGVAVGELLIHSVIVLLALGLVLVLEVLHELPRLDVNHFGQVLRPFPHIQ